MTTVYAQPYDIMATGFYFEGAEDYAEKAAAKCNAHGEPVEEYEIQFIDGDGIDVALFNAVCIHQGNIATFFEVAEEWSKDEKIRVIIAVAEGGYIFDLDRDRPGRLDVNVYDCNSLREMAEQFVDDGLFGEIPPSIANYIDYDAIARDLSADYSETVIDGARYIYRLG